MTLSRDRLDRRHALLLGGAALLGTTAASQAREEAKPVRKSRPKVVTATQGEKVWALGVLVTVKVRAEDTGGAYSVFEDVIAPGGGPPPHTHSREDETIFILEGDLVAWLDGKRYEATTGAWIHMPRGVEHYFRNLSEKPIRMLLTYSPGGFEKWFLDIGTAYKAGDTKAPAVSPEQLARAVAAAKEYGVIFSGKKGG